MGDWRNRATQIHENYVAQMIAQKEAQRQQLRDEEKRAQLKVLAKFKCHICGKVSQEPYYVEGSHGDQGSNGYTDWRHPGDLDQCIVCGKWACKRDHIFSGVCIKCAGGLK